MSYIDDVEQTTEDAEEYKKKIRIHRARIVLVVFWVMLSGLAGGVSLYHYNMSSVYTGYESVRSVERADAETARYTTYNGGVLKYSNDGAAFINAELKEEWNQTYQMQDPLYAISQDVVALADKNGTTIYEMNKSGLISEINTLLPIKKLAVSAQGLTAASLEDSGTSWIKFYSPTRGDKAIAETKILMEESGYPVSMCISPDGIKFGVAHLNVENGEARSTLAFHNLGAVGENEIDNFIGSTTYSGTIFPVFEYINSDVAVAYGTDRIQVFKGKQIPELEFEIPLEEEIVKVCYDSEHIGALMKNAKEDGKYRLDIYDLKGKLVFSKAIDRDYTDVKIQGNTIVLNNENEFCVYNIRGSMRYQKGYPRNILNITILGNNRFLVVDEKKLQVIRLTR